MNQLPQKIVIDLQRKVMPSGQVVEQRHIEEIKFLNGNHIKRRLYEVDPPLADGFTPQEIAEVLECWICLGLYHENNITRCISCGQYTCVRCSTEIPTTASAMALPAITKPVQAWRQCQICTEEGQMNLWDKLRRIFWSL